MILAKCDIWAYTKYKSWQGGLISLLQDCCDTEEPGTMVELITAPDIGISQPAASFNLPGKGAGPNGPQEPADGLPWAFDNKAYFSKREKFSLPALLSAHAFKK